MDGPRSHNVEQCIDGMFCTTYMWMIKKCTHIYHSFTALHRSFL